MQARYKDIIQNEHKTIVKGISEKNQDSEISVPDEEDRKDMKIAHPSPTKITAKETFNPSSTSTFGNISIQESSNVHFGNNTYFNGPVIIKQISNNGNGVINPSFVATEEDLSSPSHEQQNPVNKDATQKKSNGIKKWQKITCSICVSIIFIGGICTVVGVYLSNREINKQEQNSIGLYDDVQKSETPPSFPLIIAPGHLRIVPRSDWLAQFVDSKLLHKLKHPVPWVIISHTATENCTTQSQCVLRVRLIQTFHIESRRWSDIGYNFLVGGDGSAYYGRGWDTVGAHTLGYNNISVGISFIGTFNDVVPPQKQLEACKKLIKQGVELGKVSGDYKLFGHRQLASTLSPGDKLFEIISKWPHFDGSYTSSSL